jgi:DNA-binding CsgD family transcriptional regulator
VILPPAVVLVLGKRGSGKSALAYRLLELFRLQLSPYVVGVPAQAKQLLPDWVGIAPTLEELPNRCIALIDEAYLAYHSRQSLAQASTSMSQVLNLSRQREQTLLFVAQEARQVDKNIASTASVLVFKELGMLQPEFERPELRKLVGEAKEALAGKMGDKCKWAYAYSPDANFLGLLESRLPSFWKPSLSRLFAADQPPANLRAAKALTIQEKVQMAHEWQRQGLSYNQIAQRLGVSKSTVANYLKGYPYRSN